MTFTQKKIRTTLTMANGKFANGQNQVVVENLRTSCQIATTGGVSSSAMEMAIYGMPMSTMNALTNVGVKFQASYDNTVVVEAGDDESGMSTVFVGNIFAAYFDGSSMPNTCFRITAGTTNVVAQKPASATSTTKATDVGGLMSGLAKTMGLGFENAGVDLKLSPSYYFGSAWAQVVKIAQDAGITYCIERGKLVVTKPGTARQGSPVLISPSTGLIGYPRFNQQFIIVEALFNPAVQYQGPVTIQSSLPAACGNFTVNKLQYELESLVPGGKWFMELECYSVKATTP